MDLLAPITAPLRAIDGLTREIVSLRLAAQELTAVAREIRDGGAELTATARSLDGTAAEIRDGGKDLTATAKDLDRRAARLTVELDAAEDALEPVARLAERMPGNRKKRSA
jgi:hypothetical protein